MKKEGTHNDAVIDSGRVFSEILGSFTRYFAIIAVIVVIAISLSGIRVVKSGESALIFRFGKLVGDSYDEQVRGPGLLFAFPYVIDEVVTVQTGAVNKIEVTTHYTATKMSSYSHNGYVILGDSNLCILKASVQYVISDPVAYTINLSDEISFINSSVSNAMIEAASGISADELLTSGKNAYAANVQKLSQKRADEAGSGITIRSVELTEVSMPFEVREIYDYVNSAKVTAATRLENAAQYRETVIPQAQAQAQTLISSASAFSASAKAEAENSLAEFNGVLDEFLRDPEAVKTRIYGEKISRIISSFGSVKITDAGSDSKIILKGD